MKIGKYTYSTSSLMYSIIGIQATPVIGWAFLQQIGIISNTMRINDDIFAIIAVGMILVAVITFIFFPFIFKYKENDKNFLLISDYSDELTFDSCKAETKEEATQIFINRFRSFSIETDLKNGSLKIIES